VSGERPRSRRGVSGFPISRVSRPSPLARRTRGPAAAAQSCDAAAVGSGSSTRVAAFRRNAVSPGALLHRLAGRSAPGRWAAACRRLPYRLIRLFPTALPNAQGLVAAAPFALRARNGEPSARSAGLSRSFLQERPTGQCWRMAAIAAFLPAHQSASPGSAVQFPPMWLDGGEYTCRTSGGPTGT